METTLPCLYCDNTVIATLRCISGIYAIHDRYEYYGRCSCGNTNKAEATAEGKITSILVNENGKISWKKV